MTRLLLFAALTTSLFSCSTSQVQEQSSSHSSNPANSALDKTTVYKALESDVSSLHEQSVFKDDEERLFSPMNVDAYAARFAENHCTEGTSKKDCGRQFYQAALTRLTEIYFAADPAALNKTCSNEPIVCGDLVSLETLLRRLHNESVEESKQEKLSQIENWRRGKLTDEELKAALHLDFKFENGKLILAIPSA